MRIQAAVWTLLALGAATVVAAAPYSEETRQAFMRACADAAVEVTDPSVMPTIKLYCACSLDQIERKYPEKAFLDASDKLDTAPDDPAAQELGQFIDRMAEQCIQKVFNAQP
ncbi:MAG: hypothetical protein Q4G42_08335 [Neisseria sp.]|nr:hypothetical protein [Neisseria sp.]